MSPSAAPGGSWRARSPFRVAFPSSIDGRVLAQVTVDDGAVRGRSASVATALLWVLAVGGITLAVVGAIAEDRAGSEAVGAFGVEAGAALWFAGAVTLGARPGPRWPGPASCSDSPSVARSWWCSRSCSTGTARP